MSIPGSRNMRSCGRQNPTAETSSLASSAVSPQVCSLRFQSCFFSCLNLLHIMISRQDLGSFFKILATSGVNLVTVRWISRVNRIWYTHSSQPTGHCKKLSLNIATTSSGINLLRMASSIGWYNSDVSGTQVLFVDLSIPICALNQMWMPSTPSGDHVERYGRDMSQHVNFFCPICY